MAAGVTAIVSDTGWFSELPGDAVVKLDAGGHADALLGAFLKRLIEDRDLCRRIGANARAYMLAEHDIERSAHDYLTFINEIVAARPRRQLLDGLSVEMSALGVSFERDKEFALGVAAEVAALAPAKDFSNRSD
jgi:hypothetical protein